ATPSEDRRVLPPPFQGAGVSQPQDGVIVSPGVRRPPPPDATTALGGGSIVIHKHGARSSPRADKDSVARAPSRSPRTKSRHRGPRPSPAGPPPACRRPPWPGCGG